MTQPSGRKIVTDSTFTTDVSNPASEVGSALNAAFATVVNAAGYGITGDGTTDDAAAFTAAATAAEAAGADVYIPAPSVSYLLNSDPTFPEGVSIIGASPSWFSGSGKMPFHVFTEISEGVDPRIFNTKVMGYSEPVTGEDHRRWAVVGWVNYKNSPDGTAAAATESDAVGVDGRGVTSVKNGRVWGLLGLAHMTAGAKDGSGYGVSQAYAAELDVNNNTGDDANLDGGGGTPIVLGLSIVSGGTNGPAEAIRFDATNTPTNGLGDNRWHTLLRARGDIVREYVVLMDDGCEAVFGRIPDSSGGLQWTHLGAIDYAEYQDNTDRRRKMWSQTAGHGYDFIDSNGDRVFATNDGYSQATKPLTRRTNVIATPATIDANMGDIFVLTSGAASITGISGGYDGQRLTLVNATGSTITVNEDTDMRMVGTSFAMTSGSTIEFVYGSPTWFEVSRSDNA